MEHINYSYFVEEFKKITKIDLSKYKDDQMVRRLENFMKSKGIKGFKELGFLLRSNKEMVEDLKGYITINVTEFMRNEKMWEDFYTLAIPTISKNKSRIKLWSAACSSGEEPYTMAILLTEKFPHLNFEIIATDLDEEILKKAKAGMYRRSDIRSFDQRLLEKYFEKIDDKTIKAKDIIRKKVSFERHNLLEDRYPSFIDLIVCRNVLIYFKEDAKNLIYQKFATSLTQEGILFIGATEQIFRPEQYRLGIIKSFFYQKQK